MKQPQDMGELARQLQQERERRHREFEDAQNDPELLQIVSGKRPPIKRRTHVGRGRR